MSSFADQRAHFLRHGWLKLPHDPTLAHWLDRATPAAMQAVQDPQHADWLRCGGTWFAGVNILPNDHTGEVNSSGPLQGKAIDFLRKMALPTTTWDAAQVSVIYPGYPRQMPQEPDAAFRFRRDRDAAHVDGLLPIGPDKRRHLREAHAFILGLPLTRTAASPLVLWQGSHDIMRQKLGDQLHQHPAEHWPEIDLTEAYHAARRHCFKTCERRELQAEPGESYVLHRLALHGVAPWDEHKSAPAEGRAIAYFRPELTSKITDWIDAP